LSYSRGSRVPPERFEPGGSLGSLNRPTLDERQCSPTPLLFQANSIGLCCLSWQTSERLPTQCLGGRHLGDHLRRSGSALATVFPVDVSSSIPGRTTLTSLASPSVNVAAFARVQKAWPFSRVSRPFVPSRSSNARDCEVRLRYNPSTRQRFNTNVPKHLSISCSSMDFSTAE